MSNPNPTPSGPDAGSNADTAAAAMGELAASLEDMRDALVDLSLLLKDHQFETNLEQRQKIAALLPGLLEKVRQLPN